MKKIPLIICVGLMLLMVSPVQAAPHRPTGDQIDLTVASMQEYPANTPFYIYHGWENLKPGPIGWIAFELEVDGTIIAPTYINFTGTTMDNFDRFWVYNFPEGMIGEHTFTGHWYAYCQGLLRYGLVTDCSYPTAHVDLHTEHVVVTFIP